MSYSASLYTCAKDANTWKSTTPARSAPAKMSRMARGITPDAGDTHSGPLPPARRYPGGPNMVCVLPDPVWPYAKMVAL